MRNGHAVPVNTNSSSDPIRIALLGYGTVGSALHQVLVEHRSHIERATSREVEVVAALVRDATAPRPGIAGANMQLLDDADAVFALRPDIICEAMGGTDLARDLVLRALHSGTPVVTANKQLIARHGAELFAAASANDVQLRFEASVCAAIPVVRMLRESLVPARIDRVLGILNGTTNYILTAMTDQGRQFDDVLREAQQLGYAEADPTDDISGADAAAKLAILAGIAFHTRIDPADIAQQGIDSITADDIEHAEVFGCKVRLIGRAERMDDGRIAASVSPMLVPDPHPLASVQGATNGVMINGHPCGELMVQGAGAGGPETASALAGDIVGVLGSTPSFLTRDPARELAALSPVEEIAERHYVRMHVTDQPGTLADVAAAFAERSISIEQLLQLRSDESGDATLIILTHPASMHEVHAAAMASHCAHDVMVIPVLEVHS